MSSRKLTNMTGPTLEQLERELKRVKNRRQYISTLRSTVFILLAIAAVVLLAVMWLPVLQVTGSSMQPALNDGNVVVTMRTSAVEPGDLVVFSTSGGKLLIKRVAAEAGDVVDILEDGTVTVNGEALNEPYAINIEKSDYDITLPCTVPQGRVFVLGDNREYSADSRNEAIGCIPEEQIIGRALIRIWPLDTFGILLPDEQSAEG